MYNEKIIHIKNGNKYEENGWTSKCKGSPSEIGFAHGVLLADNIKRAMKNVDFVCKNDYGYTSKDLADIFYDVLNLELKKIIRIFMKKSMQLPREVGRC